MTPCNLVGGTAFWKNSLQGIILKIEAVFRSETLVLTCMISGVMRKNQFGIGQ
jgi:hypothetical protein